LGRDGRGLQGKRGERANVCPTPQPTWNKTGVKQKNVRRKEKKNSKGHFQTPGALHKEHKILRYGSFKNSKVRKK